LLSGSEPAVIVEDLSLWFRTTSERTPTVKRRLDNIRRNHRTTHIVEALDGVSFEVPLGCVYGIVGPNGAGKSTLLRAIAGIYPPAEGRISVYRRVTLLLSLGVGFKPDLTGRENVLLGGLAAGLEKDEIREHVDEIIEFADIGKAIDSPVRTYSQGMAGRLSFSVASHLDPEILLIDEALSAGDARFKRKCHDRIVSLCEGDCTVLIVSHGMGIIKRMAEQALWLDHGTVQAEGPSEDIVAAYLEHEEASEDETAMDDF
jgi:ABC-type polysaccharide/polyol phosphate transport system ATPase subunit